MADKNPYFLRNADIDNLDLSEFSKDFTAEELQQVKNNLLQIQQQHREQFDALPMADQAKIYAGEKFKEAKKAVEENPELLVAGALGATAYKAGEKIVDAATGAAQKVGASIKDRLIGSREVAPAQPVVQQPTVAEIPSVETAAQQAAQQAAQSGQIKTGKAGGAISPQEAQMLGNEASGKVKAEVADVVKGAVAPKGEVTKTPKVPVDTSGLTKEQASMKRYLVGMYGGGPEGEAAYKQVTEILKETPAYEPGQGGGLSKEATNTIKAWRKENIAGPKVNLTHDMKKAMKGAGGIAVLAAIPGFAEAAQRKDFGAMTDIATDFAVLPFAQSREAGMPKAQEESIIAQKFKQAQLLGSPYRSVPPPR